MSVDAGHESSGSLSHPVRTTSCDGAPDRGLGAPKVAILTSNFWPEATGTSQTVGEFAQYLQRQGITVAVATAMPYYPQWKIWPEYRGLIWRKEQTNGMTVYRSWHLVSPSPSTVTRLLHEITLSLLALPNMVRALRGAKSAYIATPALSYAFVSLVLARIFRVHRVLLVKDIMPDAAIELGMLRNRVVIAGSRWLARKAYALAEEIHTLGDGMRNRIAREITTPEKIRIVPDTIDPQELEPVPLAENEFRKRFVPPGTFAVVHSGNMGKKQDLDLILRTAVLLRANDKIHFYVFGDGAVKEDFLRRRESLGLVNVSHYPLQERSMLRHMLCGADVLLVSQRAEVVDIVVPSKLVTALGAGAMVVAPCAAGSESAQLVRDSGGGIVVPPGDESALAQALLKIQAGDVDTAAHRKRGRTFAERRFGREQVYGAVAREIRARIL